MKPIDISIIGTNKDPCFGKHHSIKAIECQRCGDVEVCAIISSQQIHKEIAKAEKVGRFKDMEEAELIMDQNAIIKKLILRKIEKGKKPNLKKLLEKYTIQFNVHDQDKPNLKQRIKNIIQDAS